VQGVDYAIPLTSQTRLDLLTAHRELAQGPAGASIRWEVVDGVWLDLALADIGALSSASHAWVQACYAHSKHLMALISAAAASLSVDLTLGWPD